VCAKVKQFLKYAKSNCQNFLDCVVGTGPIMTISALLCFTY
jgi:hypothetical protein